MSNTAKLRKKAAEFEQKKQFDKALALYVQILEKGGDGDDEDVDVGLYNRVGDLMLRQGNTSDAVAYYEKAVDLYAEGGFFNNAIALCNKILRQSPGRSTVYYKLGKISAKKGFKSDAKQNFLEYADRMQKAGQLDEAFRALKEFADLCPDQDDIRLMLADQLTKRERKAEALEQLQTLYNKFTAEGREAEARATVDRMKAIDPSLMPKASGSQPVQKANDLVFLDVSWEAPNRAAEGGRPTPRSATPPRGNWSTGSQPALGGPPPPPIDDLPLLLPDPVDEPDLTAADADFAPLSGLTPTSEAYDAASTGDLLDQRAMLGLEPTSFDAGEPYALSGREFGALELASSAEAPLEAPVHDLALPGELPMLDLGAEVMDADAEGGDLDLILPDDDFTLSATGAESLGGHDSTASDDFEPAPREGAFLDAPLDFDAIEARGERSLTPSQSQAPAGDDDDELPMLLVDDDAAVGDALDALPSKNAVEPATLDFLADADADPRATPLDVAALDDVSSGSFAGGSSLDDAMIGYSAGDDDESAADDALGGLPMLVDESPTDDRFSVPVFDMGDVPEFSTDATAELPDDAAIAPSTLDFLADAPDAAAAADARGAIGNGVTAPAPAGGASGQSFGGAWLDSEDLEQAPAFGSGRSQASRATPVQGSSAVAGSLRESLAALRQQANETPSDWPLRRRLAEALLEGGERDEGLQELEHAMIGFERQGDLETARSVADEIIRANPGSVRHYQKRVEYAFRTNDKPRLVDAYLELADGLFRTGQADKSRAVYQRVLDLHPDDIRALAALSAFVDVDALPPARTSAATKRVSGEVARAEGASPAAPVSADALTGDDASFVNLGDWLRDEEGPKSTRMVVAEEAPSGDEQADFNDMLKKFKQGVAENVDEDDHESHYDLGVAFKEMGLIDEAIAEFQKALRAPGRRARTYEALGQCFIEKEQFPVAATILQRALAEPGIGDDQLVGVLYLLGFASEALKRVDEAMNCYQRVFAVDIQFRDVGERMNRLDRVMR